MYSQKERFALLQKWKGESELTYDGIASTTGIPKSTVQRIIEGRTPSPAFESVAPIVVALGHTLDEYCGIAKDGKEMTMASLLKSSYEQQLHEKEIILDLRIAEKDSIIAEKDKAYAKLEKDKIERERFFHRLILVMGAAMAVFFLICAIIAFVFLYHA